MGVHDFTIIKLKTDKNFLNLESKKNGLITFFYPHRNFYNYYPSRLGFRKAN